MKKVVFILIGIITLLAIPATVFLAMRTQELRKKAAPATSLTLSPATVAKKVGEEFTLEIKINTAENQVVATEINLTFDPTKLEALTIDKGAKFPNILSSGTVGSGTATIALGAENTTSPITGVGTAAVVTFKALATTTSPVSISFAPETFVGALGESTTNVLVSSIPASVTITSNATSGTITPSPTPTPTGSSLIPTLTPTPTGTQSGETGASSLQITAPTSNQALLTDQPTLVGKAPANSTVTITIYSDPITVTVLADANGNWSYSVPNPLGSGPHTIVVAALDPITNQTNTATLAFVISDGTENGASGSAMPVSGTVENTLILFMIGIFFIFIGTLIPTFTKIRL